jgi:hypothetical protein
LVAERVPVERVAVLRLLVLRDVLRPAEPVDLRAEVRPPRAPSVFAADLTRLVVLRRFAAERVPLLRDAVVRRVPVEREPVLRLLVPVDLLRAVAICSLLVGDVGGNADVCSMRVASADIQQEPHVSYFEMSSTRSPVCASDALRAMSA